MRRIIVVLSLLLCSLASSLAGEHRIVIVSLDGCRWDYPQMYHTPFLDKLGHDGVQAVMQPSFPSSTFPNHYTLATGLVPDHHGIIANVTQALAKQNVNVLDITQTILPPDFFTMVMLVDAGQASIPFGELADQMAELGQQMGMDFRAQREDTFQAMHRI